jgi:hypothetical protein
VTRVDITVDTIRAVLVGRGAPRSADDATLLEIARSPRHKLAVTLLSAWSSAGRALSREHDDELAAHRRRIDRYRATWGRIREVAPDVHTIKGFGILRHYPPGVLRAAGDIDVICPRPAQMWRAARRLLDDGWDFEALTVLGGRRMVGGTRTAADRPEILLELRKPPSDGIDVPYVVGLATPDIFTSLRMPPRRLSAPGRSWLATNVVALLAERWERRFNSRDLLDIALLATRFEAVDRAALRVALDETTLWPEWYQAVRAVARIGLPPPPALPGQTRSRLRTRVGRAAGTLARWAHPARAAGYLVAGTVDADLGRLADRLAGGLYERVGAPRLLRLGVPLFGVPLADTASDTGEVRLDRRGRHAVARTPIGSFLLVPGACRAEWLDDVRRAFATG